MALLQNGFCLAEALDMTDVQRRLWLAAINKFHALVEKQHKK